MGIKKLGDSEVFKLILAMVLILEACMISASIKDGVSAITQGIRHTIILNRVEAEEVARETVGSLVEVNLSSTVELSDQSGGHNPKTGEDIEGLVRRYFGSEYKNALKVMQCESQGNPSKIGDKHLAFIRNGQVYGKSYGLFQIRSGGIDKGVFWKRTGDVSSFEREMLDSESNIRYASRTFHEGGWHEWTCGRRIVLGENI